MSRLTIPDREAAPAASQPLLDSVHAQLGVGPNLFRLVGSSPAALEGFLGLSGALGKTLDLKTRNRIALATAQVNGCDDCMSARSDLGANLAKLDEARWPPTDRASPATRRPTRPSSLPARSPKRGAG